MQTTPESTQDNCGDATVEHDNTENCCCYEGLSCFKKMLFGAWGYFFSSNAKQENQAWQESDESQMEIQSGSFSAHDVSSEIIRMKTQGSGIGLTPSTDDKVFLKGRINDIYKQQDQIMKHIESSKKSKGKLDVYNLRSAPPRISDSVDDSGLPSRLINAILVTPYKQSSQLADDRSPRECPICTTPFEEGDPVKILQCLHMYHASCVDQWLAKKSTCPDCKFNLRALDFQQFM